MTDAVGTLRLRLPTPGADVRRLRDAATAALAAARRDPEGGAPGERVVLVRRLRLTLVVPAAEPEAMAAAAGRALHSAVRRALARSMLDTEVITFASPAEYLARFIEEYVAGRAVDVWYFAPLARFVRASLAETLAGLAEEERDSWGETLALLRASGAATRLVQRLPPAELAALCMAEPVRRRLAIEEARPLWAAAAAVAESALGAHRPSPTRSEREDALRAYLQEGRAAPRSWASAGALAAAVAEMVRWLLERAAAPGTDTTAAAAALARHDWLDPRPILRAVEAVPSARATRPGPTAAAPARVGAPAPRLNRTRALAFLAAARGQGAAPLAEGTSRDSPALIVASVAASLAPLPEMHDPAAVVRLLRGPGGDVPGLRVDPRALAALRAAAAALGETEVRELAEGMVEGGIRAAVVEVSAAGLFLLIRPLTDLRVLAAARSAGIGLAGLRRLLHEVGRRAGAEEDAATVFACGSLRAPRESPGPLPDEQETALVRALHGHAAAAHLAWIPEPEPPAAAYALAVACRQMVRWLHGFEKSSQEYVLREFVRRPGSLSCAPHGAVRVEWRPGSFDVLLDRAGYLDPVERVGWWDDRGLKWTR